MEARIRDVVLKSAVIRDDMLNALLERDPLYEQRRATAGDAACRDELCLIGERKGGLET